MSVEAVRAVFAHSNTKGGTRLVMLCLAEHLNRKTGRCTPGLATIQRETKMTAHAVIDAIARAVELGELRRGCVKCGWDVKCKGGNGHGSAYALRLSPAPDAALSPAPDAVPALQFTPFSTAVPAVSTAVPAVSTALSAVESIEPAEPSSNLRPVASIEGQRLAEYRAEGGKSEDAYECDEIIRDVAKVCNADRAIVDQVIGQMMAASTQPDRLRGYLRSAVTRELKHHGVAS